MATRAEIDTLIARTEQKISDARADEAAAKAWIKILMKARRDLVEMVAEDDLVL